MTINIFLKIEKKQVLIKIDEIRGVEILKNIPLHLETIEKPILKTSKFLSFLVTYCQTLKDVFWHLRPERRD